MICATKKAKLIQTLRHRWLTPLEAVAHCGLFSLSQRVGEIKRDPDLQAQGWIVRDKWVRLASGSKVKAYKLVRIATDWTA